MTDTKIIFSLVDNAEDMLEACSLNKVNCPIVAVRVDQRQWFPDGVIDLGCLTTPAGTVACILSDVFILKFKCFQLKNIIRLHQEQFKPTQSVRYLCSTVFFWNFRFA